MRSHGNDNKMPVMDLPGTMSRVHHGKCYLNMKNTQQLISKSFMMVVDGQR